VPPAILAGIRTRVFLVKKRNIPPSKCLLKKGNFMIYIQNSCFFLSGSKRTKKGITPRKSIEELKEKFPDSVITRPGMRDIMGFLREDGAEFGIQIVNGYIPYLYGFYKGFGLTKNDFLQFLDWLEKS
jgi:hypothetical protein